MFNFKKSKTPFVSVVIAAGGSSSRMNNRNKLLLEVGGVPVLAHTLLAFEKAESINEIIISAHEDNLQLYADIAEKYKAAKVSKVVKGGESRLHSVYNAAINTSKKADIILVHDAARPFIEESDIKQIISDVQKYGSAAAANKMTDTVKKTENGLAVETVDRSTLYTVQTPQGADRDVLLAALQSAVDKNDSSVTDECSALEKIGVKPYMCDTSRSNIKITYPEDLELANAIFDRRNRICE